MPTGNPAFGQSRTWSLHDGAGRGRKMTDDGNQTSNAVDEILAMLTESIPRLQRDMDELLARVRSLEPSPAHKPPACLANIWKCDACGHEWESASRPPSCPRCKDLPE